MALERAARAATRASAGANGPPLPPSLRVGLRSCLFVLEETATTETSARSGFQPTVWTVVLNSGSPEALEKLCHTYWPPIYCFLRGQGHRPEEAKDLTQGFFVHLLAKDRLAKVSPAKGKFRSFLLACLNNYVRGERDKERAQKRGAGIESLRIDTFDTEQRFGIDPADARDPARIYDQQWARVLLARVLEHLKVSCAQNGKAELYATLQPYLTGDAGRGDYGAVAARLRMSEGAVRVAVSRLRDDFRRLLRAQVAQTVENPGEVEDEIRHLFRAFLPA